MSNLADLLRKKYDQYTSLDTPKDESLLDTGIQMAAGFVPGIGQAMAARDVERARRDDDPAGMALAGASFLPFGKLAGAVKKQIIAGKGAKYAPLDEMAAGEAALAAGKDPTEVWQNMGVMRGLENHAPTKWEIPDQNARFNVQARWSKDRLSEGYSGRLGEMLDHPELFKNYPHLKDIQVLSHVAPDALAEGGYHVGRKGQPAFIEASGKSRQELMDVILHEIQHGVQAKEGFDSGSNYNYIKDAMMQGNKVSPAAADTRAFNTYRNNMGEAEARAVETRRGQSQAFNRSVMPTESYDVPLKNLVSEDQIAALVKKLRSVAPTD